MLGSGAVRAGRLSTACAEQRRRLQVGDEVTYRSLQLVCGSRVLLSEAENWYVPGRLDAAPNRLLETTDTPFGKAVQSLDPYRQTFAATLLGAPLPVDGTESAGRLPVDATGALNIPDALLEHRAVLYTREHKPFSEGHEVYERIPRHLRGEETAAD